MPKLIIIRDQLHATEDGIIVLDSGINLIDALMRHVPEGVDPESSQLFLNKELINLNSNVSKILNPLKDDDILTLVLEVKGLDPITIAIIFVVSVALSYALAPSIPGNVGQTKQSPNNTLQAQTNIARAYEAFPLIFGSPISYPDLTGEPIIEYIVNRKHVTQLMSVCVGLASITAIRAGKTPIANFIGSSSTIYSPVSKNVNVPNVIESFSINEIDGQEIEGAGIGIVLDSFNLTESGIDLTTYIGSTFKFRVVQNTGGDALKDDFDAATGDYTLKVNYKAIVSDPGPLIDLSGSGTVVAILDFVTFYEITIVNFNGEKSDESTPSYSFDTPFLTESIAGSVVGPIDIGISAKEIWFNFLFNRGLKSTVKLRIAMQELDGPNGSPVAGPQQSFVFEYTEDTLEQQFRTFKGVLTTEGFYRFTISRDDIETDNTNKPDETKIESVSVINRFTNKKYGNLTMLEVNVPATINATSLRENKINLDLTARVISYDTNTSTVITAVQSSRKFADALLHLYVDFYGLDANTLALDELYAIQESLDAIDPRLATFDFTFDDIDVSLEERMDAILQVARCFKWLDGDVYRFGRNEKKLFESTTITRRDIAQDSDREYSLSYNPQLTENYDSIKIEYVDKTFNKKTYIYRKLDGAGDVIDGIGTNPKSIELAGCSETFNAINRAELEMRTLIHQRFNLTDTMLPSGMLLDRGDMVLYAEQYDTSGNIFDGEILAVNGNIATISESITFDPLDTYQIHYTIEDGTSVGPFPVTEVANEPFKFECTSLTQAYVRDSVLGFLIQTGSRYIISTTEELDAAKWTVTQKEASGRNVQLTLVNYSDRIYDFDGV